jgi:RNAse (barnase) inhibitor barstar
MNRASDLILDFSDIETEKALHDYLFKALRFPDYYGSNWDAFDECIRDVTLPRIVRIQHFSKLESRVPRGARLLRACFDGFCDEHPGVTEIEYCEPSSGTNSSAEGLKD